MNSAGQTCIAYLKVALEEAEKEQWHVAEANAHEASLYANTADKIKGVEGK